MKSEQIIIGVMSIYNPLSSCCENIKRILGMVDCLIIMDDSEDTKSEIIRSVLSEKTCYEWNGGNIGLSKSINKGIKKAIDRKADWILLMDQDSTPENDILSVYKEFIRIHNTANIALLSPQYNYDRHKRNIKVGHKEIHFANMSGSLLNVRAIEHIGLYDERYYIDGLDIEWCLRAIRAGYKLIQCSEAMLNHCPAETRELKVFSKVVYRYGWDIPSRYYYQFRAGQIIHEEYHSCFYDMFCLYKYLKAMFLFENKKAYRKAWIQAKEDFNNGFFGKYDGG